MADSDLQAEPPRPPKPRCRPTLEDEDEDVGGPDTKATGWLLPYKNPLALIGFCVGVFSLILARPDYWIALVGHSGSTAETMIKALLLVVGLLLGGAALILGILGLRYRYDHPTARGAGHAIAGILLGWVTSVDIMVIVGMDVLRKIVGDLSA
jgi:hypothetical protein